MQAFVTFHVPDGLALTRAINADEIVGRDHACAVCIEHASISRRHACFRLDEDGNWSIVDLNSKNGLRSEGVRRATVPLMHGNWFAVGDVFARFELVDDVRARDRMAAVAHRRTGSQTTRALLLAEPAGPSHLDQCLIAFVQLAECRRGFVLDGNGRGAMQVIASVQPAGTTSASPQFDGSAGAVQRCARERRPVFLSNLPDAAWLRARPSVVAGGVRALVCLPLLNGGDMLGVLYADTDDSARIFDELDGELLSAFAEDVATWLAARVLDARLQALAERVADESAPRPGK